eukprot:scaffold15260_cov86-Phaeocystis_antarctica.AAC.1
MLIQWESRSAATRAATACQVTRPDMRRTSQRSGHAVDWGDCTVEVRAHTAASDSDQIVKLPIGSPPHEARGEVPGCACHSSTCPTEPWSGR